VTDMLNSLLHPCLFKQSIDLLVGMTKCLDSFIICSFDRKKQPS
jgi:hypothetical protein